MHIYKHSFEFLYCFDDNFNKQGFTSIISLLENVSEPISINVIHPNKDILNHLPSKISKHPNLKTIVFKTFKNYDYDFPNLANTHISEATYYRIFMNNYIHKDVQNIIYIDADIICLTNPIETLYEVVEKIHDSDLLISAKTEFHIDSAKDDTFKRLGITSKYFNAGFMVINYQKWQKESVQESLLQILKENYSDIVFWDQDILNIYINGKFIELNANLNFYAQSIKSNLKKYQPYFIHYVGSKKPWLTSGAFEICSEVYHSNYRKIYNSDYHIEHKWRYASLKELLFSIIKLKIFRLDNLIKYLKEFIVSLKN